MRLAAVLATGLLSGCANTASGEILSWPVDAAKEGDVFGTVAGTILIPCLLPFTLIADTFVFIGGGDFDQGLQTVASAAQVAVDVQQQQRAQEQAMQPPLMQQPPMAQPPAQQRVAMAAPPPAVNQPAQGPVGQSQDLRHCLQEKRRQTGEHCGNPRSQLLVLSNVCHFLIDAQMCIEASDGSASCGSATAMKHGDTVTQYVCDGTGRGIAWACLAGETAKGLRQGNCGGNHKQRQPFASLQAQQ
jgi:hypothetical protein